MSFKSSTLHTGYNTNMKEEWRAVIGYEGLYVVSNLGRVKSYKVDEKGRVMKLLKTTSGYLSVGLYKDKVCYKHLVSRLVAKAFIHNPENKLEVNHIDNNPLNNNFYNLEWCTSKENKLHCILQNRKNIQYGENNPKCKLSNKDIREIRKSDFSVKYLSIKYNIDKSYLYKIRKGLKR